MYNDGEIYSFRQNCYSTHKEGKKEPQKPLFVYLCKNILAGKKESNAGVNTGCCCCFFLFGCFYYKNGVVLKRFSLALKVNAARRLQKFKAILLPIFGPNSR